VYDEWMEPRIPVLAKPWDSLDEEEKNEADSWILNQFKLKNDKLRYKRSGLFVIDRGPIDPLAFTDKKDRSHKAKKLKERYSPRKAPFEVMPGKVIFMTGESNELELRMKITGRSGYTKARLEKMEKDLLEVYGKDNVIFIDTKGLTVEQVVKKVAEFIHLGEYEETDMQQMLDHWANK